MLRCVRNNYPRGQKSIFEFLFVIASPSFSFSFTWPSELCAVLSSFHRPRTDNAQRRAVTCQIRVRTQRIIGDPLGVDRCDRYIMAARPPPASARKQYHYTTHDDEGSQVRTGSSSTPQGNPNIFYLLLLRVPYT